MSFEFLRDFRKVAIEVACYYATRIRGMGEVMIAAESDEEVSVFDDPAYRERYREKFLEARKRGMDMVVYPDGTIALIENKVVLHTYGWRKRRGGGFEKLRAAAPVAYHPPKRAACESVINDVHAAKETECV